MTALSDDDANEDWAKLSSWDFWDITNGTQISTLAGLMPFIPRVSGTSTPQQDVAAFMKLPAWNAAPAKLKTEAEAFVSGMTPQ